MRVMTILGDGYRASRLIATAVTLAATGLFTYSASETLSAAFAAPGKGLTNSRDLLESLLLSVALVVLAWKRASEIRKSEEAEAEAKENEFRLSYVDHVTGLHNRRYLHESVFPALGNKAATLLLLDLDGFKQVNDLYGHSCGDRLLAEVARRLDKVCPSGSHIIRLGGDEFAICMAGTFAIAETSRIAASLVEVLSQPFALGEVVARIGASIGIAAREDGNLEIEKLLHRSDIAMYEAKRTGRSRYVWFDEEMEARLLNRNRLESDIRSGIENGQFVPYFQPLFDLKSSTVKGFEVLARWNHPERGLVLPDDFIPIAETSGLISELSLGVMRTALTQARNWPDHLILAVNISPIQFKDPLLADRIFAVLKETRFPAQRLEIEITESSILQDKALTLATVNRLKDRGARISLDDFGTGYASLSQLRELPFDRIKIDKSFVATILQDQQSNAIVNAIAALGKSLSLPITAEGVEQQSIMSHLMELGCSDAQGWLFGKALSAEEAGRIYLEIGNAPMLTEAVAEASKVTFERRDFARRGG
jgi:diguanylate cyclase (GGDEF)-like protein